MKSYTTWIAEDGEEFASEEECLAYENRFNYAEEILHDQSHIEFYRNGERITDIKIDDNCNFYFSSNIMIIKTLKAIEALAAVHEKTGYYDFPHSTGFYCYFGDPSLHWIELNEDILSNFLTIPQEVIKAMLN